MKPLLKFTEKIIEKKISRFGSIQTHIFLNWHFIAEQYAQVTTPESIKFYKQKKNEGLMVLKVQSAYGPEVQMAIPFLLNQINSRFGYKAISTIKIKQTDIGFLNKERTSDKDMNKEINEALISDQLEDEELKIAMRKLELSRKNLFQ